MSPISIQFKPENHLTDKSRSHLQTHPPPPLTDQGEPEAEMENTAILSDPGSSQYLPGHSKPYDPRAAADAQESMKAKLVTIRKKLVEQVSV